MANTEPKQPRKIWRIVLVLSLAMNLAVVGLVTGVGLRSANGKPPQNFELGIGPLGQAMTMDERRNVGVRVRNDSRMKEFGRRGGGRHIESVIEALRAEPYDGQALEAALTLSSQQLVSIQEVAREAFAAEVSMMTDAQRLALADRLEEVRKKRRGP